GSIVVLSLSVDQKAVQGVFAEGPTLNGVVKAVNPGASSITVASPAGRGGDAEEKTFEVAKNAVILLDDGKGRRFSLKAGKLTDVPVGSVVSVRLSADQKQVGTLRAEGASVGGRVKSVDATKNIIIIEVFLRRGENPEEKTFEVAKGARIMIDGNEAKLADV